MNPKQLKKMMAQAQQMQAGVTRMQEELAEARVEGTAADGLVKAVVTGQGSLVDIDISPEVVDPEDVEMLEDLVVAAVRDAEEAASELSRSKMQELGLPSGGLL